MTPPFLVVPLPGLTPVPLGNYLAALGVLRAVGKAHPDARGWWQDGEFFCLRSGFAAAPLIEYLLNDWQPSVFIRPWEPDPKQDRATLGVLPTKWESAQQTLRFCVDCVEQSLQIKQLARRMKERKKFLDRKAGSPQEKKARLKSDKEYQTLASEHAVAVAGLDRQLLRSRCPEAALPSFDATLVTRGEQGATITFAPLLGSGGNDGKRDFMLVYLRQLREVLTDRASSRGWLTQALGLSAETTATHLPPISGNSWFPDSVKLHNSGQNTRFFSEQPASPWAYLLACEGIQLLAGTVARRLGSAAQPAAVFPFTLRAPSPASRDVAEKEKFEFWSPLWEKPATLNEITFLLKQGRVTLQGRSVLRPHHMGQAILARGVQQGISQFQRHTLLHTTSKNTFEAVPRERYRVGGVPAQITACLAELRSWDDHLPRETSRVVLGFRRRVEDAILAVCEQPAVPERWRRLLITCALVDLRIDRNKEWRKQARPVPPLSLRWLKLLIGEGRHPEPELVVAASLASLRGAQKDGGEVRQSPLRENIFGVRVHESRERTGNSWAAFTEQPSPRAVWSGIDLLTDLSEILRRRCLDTPLTEPLALGGAYSCPPETLARFVAGQLDDHLIQKLVPALTLLNWSQALPRWETGKIIEPAVCDLLSTGLPAAERPGGKDWWIGGASPTICYLKPLFQPHNFLLDPRRRPRVRAFGDRMFPPRAPEALAKLLAGDLPRAVEEATRRLRTCDLRPVPLDLVHASGDDCRCLAAALLVPWSHRHLRRALRRINELPAQNP